MTSGWRPAPRRRELHPVRPPIGLDGVAQTGHGFEHCVLVVRIEVHIDVTMRPRLSAHQGVDTPPALEPEPAADRAHGVDDLENDGQDHAFPILHDAIIRHVRGPAGSGDAESALPQWWFASVPARPGTAASGPQKPPLSRHCRRGGLTACVRRRRSASDTGQKPAHRRLVRA
jgi:hypothetical protein